MFYALTWFVVVALLSLWSLAAWAMHAAAVWMVSNAGALSGLASGKSIMDLPDWLAPWVPPEAAQWASQAMQALAPLIQSLLEVAPAMAGGLTVVAWVIWGIGSALLMLLGVGLHWRIALLRRRLGGAGGAVGLGHGPTSARSLVAGLLR